MDVLIPTLKRTDVSCLCSDPNVITVGMRSAEKPGGEMLRAAYYCRRRTDWPDKGLWEYGVSCEVIHRQHHYSGDKLRFLLRFGTEVTAGGLHTVLSNVNGTIFLKLAKGGITYEEAAAAAERHDARYDYSEQDEEECELQLGKDFRKLRDLRSTLVSIRSANGENIYDIDCLEPEASC